MGMLACEAVGLTLMVLNLYSFYGLVRSADGISSLACVGADPPADRCQKASGVR